MNCNQATLFGNLMRARTFGLVFVFLMLLTSCLRQDEPPGNQPPEQPSEPSKPSSRSLTDWTIDPDFDVETLVDLETQAWYRQIGVVIAAEEKIECPSITTPPEEYPEYPSSGTMAACSAVKHYVGRGLNFYVGSLLNVFRITGDVTLLAEVDRVMEIARSRLRDTDGDSYRNWSFISEKNSGDFNTKEDSLAHGFIAQVAYVFQKNASYSTPEHDYAAHADAWVDYLRGEFEAKWAERPETADTEGLPVRPLMHPFMEMLRYNVYMAELFPNEARYRRMHQKLSGIALSEFKTDATPEGNALVWSHSVRQWRNSAPSLCLPFQMGTYPLQTMSVFINLALEGYSGFSDTVKMQELSRSLSESIMQPTSQGFLYKDVGGLRNGVLDPNIRKETYIEGWCFKDAGFIGSGNNFRSEGSYQALPWGFLAAFSQDADTELKSNEIYRSNQEIYGNPVNGNLTPKAIHIPAAMAFSRLYVAGDFSLAR